MPITKAQARNNLRIDSWLYDQPYKPSAKAKPMVAELHPSEVHECFTPVRSRELGAFFTPLTLSKAAWYIISGYCFSHDKVFKTLDPCAGIGALGAEGGDLLDLDITAIEIDRQHHDIGKKLYPKWNWNHGNAFYQEIEDGSFDLVIANPPYNIPTDAPENYVSTKSEHRFLELAIRALKPEGYGAFLCPYNFWEKRTRAVQAICNDNNVQLIHQEKLGGGFAQTSVNVELFLFQKDCTDY